MNRTRAFARGLRRALCSALTIAFLLASQTALAVSSDADEAAGTAKPGICTPVSLTLSDDASGDIHSDDTGVATYVGGDFVVGNKNTNQNWWSNDGIGGSYAGETEGVTIVKGDFLSHPLKGFFTMGMVAFGAQYLPADGSTVLTVGGKSQTLSGKGSPSHLQAWQQYTGIKSTTSPKDQAAAKSFTYNADIAGPMSDVWGQTNKNNSLQMYKGSKGFITTNDADALSHVKIGGTTHDYSNEDQHIADLSDNLAKLADTGTVTTGSAPSGTMTYKKYDADPTHSHTLTFTDTFSDSDQQSNAEKLVYFTGDGTSALQVFTVTPEQLSSDGWRGTDFKFTNIPDGANVVINVTGKQVSWRNGWRLWWGDEQIGNGFSKDATATQRKLYTDVAQKIMWNFPQAKDSSDGTAGLTIMGAQTNEANQTNSTDDPAAALLGSVLVPDASFDDHVTTNGRVWVGGDFMMDNPTQAGNSGSASVLDMDQERHNLPWNGAVSSTCSAVEWYKTNQDGSTFLAGSEWGVYASRADAENKQNAILRVSDNGDNDWSSEKGHLLLQSLVPNATYYITETGAPEGYTLNQKIYTVTTTTDGTVAKLQGDGTVTDPMQSAVYARRRRLAAQSLSADGTDASSDGTSSTVRTINYIADTPNNLDWQKTDRSGRNLAGSTWHITDDSGNMWAVTDTIGQTPQMGVSLASEQLTVGSQTKATATFAQTVSPMPSVEWRSSDTSIATVAADGTVSAVAPGDVEIIARAGTQRAIAVLSVTSGSGDTPISEKGEFSLRGGSNMQRTATQRLAVYFGQDPLTAGQLTQVTWASSNPSVAKVDADGTVRAVADGTTTITATYTGASGEKRSARLLLTVSAEGSSEQSQQTQTVVWFQQNRRPGWTNGVYIHYSVDDGSHWTAKPQAMTKGCDGWYKYTITGTAGKNIRIDFANAADLHASEWDNGGRTGGYYSVDPSAETAVFYTDSMAVNDTAPCAVEVSGLTITGDGVSDHKLTLPVDSAIILGVTVTPKQASALGVTWKSSDPSVAQVTSNGSIGGYKAGTATVTASITTSKGTVSDSIEVTVTDGTQKGGLDILGPEQVRLGKTAQLSAKRRGTTVTDVTWASNSPDIISVDASTGVVTGKTVGIATITATTRDGKYAGSIYMIVLPDVLPALTDTDPAGGKFSIGGLPDGVYHLYEDTAPDGYSVNPDGGDELAEFRVNGDGITVISYDKKYVTLGGTAGTTPVVSDPASTARWTKTDGTTDKNPLAGAVWTITRYTGEDYSTVDTSFGTQGSVTVADCVATGTDASSACASSIGSFTDVDPAAGKVEVDGLHNGWYRLSEKTAPAGYRRRTSDKDFRIDNATWDGAHLNFGRIVNNRQTGTASWRKVDASDADRLLAGSQWRLVRTWTEKDSSGAQQKKTAAYDVIDNEGTGTSCTASEPSDSTDGVLCDTDAAAGKFTVAGLKWGDYALTETQAPDKYLLNHQTFTVTEDQKSATIGVSDGSFTKDIAFGAIGDENRKYALPITGSKWAVAGLFAALGLALLLAGALALGNTGKRGERS